MKNYQETVDILFNFYSSYCWLAQVSHEEALMALIGYACNLIANGIINKDYAKAIIDDNRYC
jgi:hypothetical protein